MSDTPTGPEPSVPAPAAGRRPSRVQRIMLILFLAPIAFVLSPLILFVAVCALLVRK